MNLIDQIKADREAGTPGRIDAAKQLTLNIARSGWNLVVWSKRATIRADARRIARVPDMEAALIAAAELADLVDAYLSDERLDNLTSQGSALDAFRKAIGETK